MKQNLRYSLLMLFMAVMLFGASGAFAADETITFSQQGYDNSEEITTVSGTNFTITFNKGTGSNAPKYYNTGTAIRVYGGNYFTVSSSTKTIEKIELTFSSGEGSNAITTDVATYSNGTWTGSAQSVKFTVGGTTGHRRLASVAVTYATGGGGDDDDKIDIATLNSISPTQLEVNDEGAFTLDATFAEGTVAGEDYEVSWSSGNEDVLMVDATTGEFMAIDAGTVDVTVLVTVLDDETYNEVSKTFTVTVTAPMTFETVTLPYTESFAGDFGKFQSDGEKAGTTDVWTITNTYAKGSAYISGTRYPCTSYLYSPILDLSNETAATLTFSHVGRYFGTPADEAKLVVRQKDGDLWGEWEPLTIENFTNSSSWTFADATIDLSAYAGQQVQLAFVYICPSTSTAGTWEIKDLAVTNGVQKIDIATLNGISPTNVEIGDFGEFTLDATFAEGTVADEDYEISWTSSDPTILEVAGNMYEAKATGTVEVTVSVTVLDDTKYNEVSETFSVTVTEPFDATAYELVTDASTLADGDEIIIAYVADNTAVAMGEQKTANRSAVGVQVNSDGILVNNADVQLITLEKDGNNFYFNVGDGYLYASSSNANQMKTEDEADDNAKATISILSGEATITFQGSNARNIMRYNPNSGSPIFSCYSATSSVQTCPQIYRKAEPVTVTVGQHGYATYCGDKNLDFAAAKTVAGADATINVYAVTEVNNGYMGMTQFDDNMYVAEQGAIMKAEADTYVVPVAIANPVEVTGNLLVGNATQEAITVPGGTNVYRFGYSPAAGKVGFMQSSSDFTVASGKAYLKINSTNNAPAFLSFDGTATGIDAANVSTTAADGQRYNLNGQRVNSNYRGVVIVDGKKLIQK